MFIEPLQYPKDWPRVVKRHFLLGLPFVGAQEPVYRDICAQLRARTDEYWNTWGDFGARQALARFVAHSLATAAQWPVPIFIPPDPFVLMAWDHRAVSVDDLSVQFALDEIAEHIGVKRNVIAWDRFEHSTFGEVVDNLLQLKPERGA